MQYPLISEYVRAIHDAGDNLGELAHLVPVLDNHGEPYRSSGAFAVVFKMKDEQTGKLYALKCFTEEQEGRAEAYRQIADELECVASPYLTSVRYLEKELFVDSSCEEEEFPVLLMDWVDGETMETYIAANHQDEYAMAMLCYHKVEVLSTEVTEEDLKNAVVDEFGVKYSRDGKRLLKAPWGLKDTYTIKRGTKVVCDWAFMFCDLSNIVIPDSVTSLGDRTFYDCCPLSNIFIPNSVTSIGDGAFYGCSSLSSIIMSNSVTSIGDGVFCGCSSLANVVIPSSVTKMDGNPFSGWNGELEILTSKFIYDNGVLFDEGRKKLVAFRRSDTSYIIPDSVTSIGDSAFESCSSLSSIAIPNGVTSIGNGAFSGCCSLSNIVIPDGVASIGDRTFYDCSSLSNIVIPDGVASIGDSAFHGCNSLSSIVIPDSVTSMDGNTFLCWHGDLEILTSRFIYDNGVLFDDGKKILIAFRRNDTSYIIPDSVTRIGNSAFYDCCSLSNIVIPNSVISIGEGAFHGCRSLTNIVIPNSVTNIGNSAFNTCI